MNGSSNPFEGMSQAEILAMDEDLYRLNIAFSLNGLHKSLKKVETRAVNAAKEEAHKVSSRRLKPWQWGVGLLVSALMFAVGLLARGV